jgi:L-ascorbate 6-phosphate lactonase
MRFTIVCCERRNDVTSKASEALLDEITRTNTTTPTLWWLGHSGFAIKFMSILFLVDPCLGNPEGRVRLMPSPLAPERIRIADMILCTHAHGGHMDPFTVKSILAASPRARVVLPKGAAEQAKAAGIPYDRVTTTDSGLRVEFLKNGLYGRVYAVPSAHSRLNVSTPGGHPCLGYIIRFENTTIYHAGDGVLYDELVTRLRPYKIDVAILPISGRGFPIADAAQLTHDIGAQWLIPMHYGTFSGDNGAVNRFQEHMLGAHPEQRYKVFFCGEKWTIPTSAA